jgi:ABC-type branched-subunit amino acid transport system ATPase component
MITVKNLSKHFGGIKAVDGVDCILTVVQLQVGWSKRRWKTTMFNLIAGPIPSNRR